MMARRGVFGMLAGGAAALLGGCDLSGANSYRYKMTVEVGTPEGVKRGSAVRQVTYQSGSGWFPFGESRGRISVRGEAVVVELPGRRTLFALLRGADDYVDYAGQGISTIFRVMDRDIGLKGGPHELWPNTPTIREPITNPMPMLVTFADINDPESVELVDPANLSRSFGPGVVLNYLSVEVTDDPVTSAIGKSISTDFWRTKAAIHNEELSRNGGAMQNPYFGSLLGKISRSDFTTEAGQ